MRSIESHELPISWPAIPCMLDQALADQFCALFQMPPGGQPLTMSCSAFSGMFKLLDAFEVNWLRLLHVQQSFHYLQPIDLPTRALAQSSLVRIRSRAGMIWLTFENVLWDEPKQHQLIVAESTILIQLESA